jgi:uncharacterized protein with PQ loop repeat
MVSKNDKSLLLKIMVFYSLLSFFIGPAIGLHFIKTKNGITYGMLIGIFISIVLWQLYGVKKLEIK